MLFRTRGSVWTCEKRKKSKNHEKVREKMEQRKGSCTITHWYISDKLLYYPWKINKFTFVFICQLLIPINLFTISNWWLEVYFFLRTPHITLIPWLFFPYINLHSYYRDYRDIHTITIIHTWVFMVVLSALLHFRISCTRLLDSCTNLTHFAYGNLW